jgi:hypothetical protein
MLKLTSSLLLSSWNFATEKFLGKVIDIDRYHQSTQATVTLVVESATIYITVRKKKPSEQQIMMYWDVCYTITSWVKRFPIKIKRSKIW